jgi:periplasmic divalent cation tolerance protein
MAAPAPGAVSVAYTTTRPADAEAFAAALVESRLVACVNITPVRSVYRWKGALEREDEALLIVKLPTSNRAALLELVRKHHAYETPEVLFLDVAGGHAPYLDWVLAEAGGAPSGSG